MCEYCDQLKHIVTQSPTKVCPTCAKPLSVTDTSHTCSRCVLYALIYQNTFAHRWNDIQTALTATRHTQLHPSLNSPRPVQHTTPPRDRGKPSVPVVPITTALTRPRPKMIINLALTSHTLEAIQQVLMTTPASRHCSVTHISPPPPPRPCHLQCHRWTA